MRQYKIIPTAKVKAAQLSKDAQQRLTWIDWYHSHGKNARLTCRHFGISPDTFYRWFKRYKPTHLQLLEDDPKTRRPRSVRQMTTDPKILQLIYNIRKADVEKSKWEIHEELKRQGILVAHNVIQKIINRHEELKSLPHTRKASRKQRYTIEGLKADRALRDQAPGELVQIDTKHLRIAGTKFYLFVAIDTKSRYAFVWAYSKATSNAAADFLLRVKTFFPFAMKASNTDNGPEYLKDFHTACITQEMTHYFTYPHTPQMNGRAERMIKTVVYEFFNYQYDLVPTIREINKRCVMFNDKYNNHRFHHALNYQTPAEYVTRYLQEKGEVSGI